MSLKSEAIKTKIAALQAKLVEALAAEASSITADKLTVGADITFKFGKGEVKLLAGKVLGLVIPGEGVKGGTLVRVLTGKGVNTRVVSIFVSAVTSIIAAEGEAAAE